MISKNEIVLNANTNNHHFDEEKLDCELSKYAIQHGWAENRLKLCARVMRIMINQHAVVDKDMRERMRTVIKFLEEYDLE